MIEAMFSGEKNNSLLEAMKQQTDSAIKELSNPDIHRDQAIYSVRKRCKLIRAILKLLQPNLRKNVYAKHNFLFRDVAKNLSEARDAKVMVETFKFIQEHLLKHVEKSHLKAVHQALVENYTTIYAQTLGQEDALDSTRCSLQLAYGDIETLSLPTLEWDLVALGLEKTYKRGKDLFQKSAIEPAPFFLHEWRKQSKYFSHQLQVLIPYFNDAVKYKLDQFLLLSRLLGRDHDLAVLSQFLKENYDFLVSENNIADIIDQYAKRERHRIFELGQQLYHEQPSHFIRNLKQFWLPET